MNTQRIETLVDGVFAIAMTLLVLDVRISQGLSGKDLVSAIMRLWPQIAAYIVSFMVLAVYWIGHHNQYYWIKYTNRIFIWINVCFLMCIAFLPFSTSLLASYPDQVISVFVYGMNVILAGLALYLHWLYAIGPGKLTKNHIDTNLKQTTSWRILRGIGFYIIATCLSLISPKVSLALFAILPFFYMPLSSIDRFFKKRNT